MAEQEPTHEEIVAQREQFQAIPEFPKNVTISDRWRDLYDDLRANVDARPPGDPERGEGIRALRDLVRHVTGEIPKPGPGPVVTVQERIGSAYAGDRSGLRGKAIRESRDADGQLVSQEVLDEKETAAMQQGEKDRLDARESIKDLREQAKNLRALALMNEQVSADGAALREEATKLEAEAAVRLEMFKATVPASEWNQYDLVAAPKPVAEGVDEALKLLAEDKIEELYELSRDFTPRQMYELVSAAGDKYEDAFKKLSLMESTEKSERHMALRDAGLV